MRELNLSNLSHKYFVRMHITYSFPILLKTWYFLPTWLLK